MNETERLNEIRERAEKATAGPWSRSKRYKLNLVAPSDQIIGWSPGLSTKLEGTLIGGVNAANADFIAHARDDIPLLLAEVDRLLAKIADAWDEGRHAGVELVNTGAAFTTRRHDAENPYRSLAEGKTE